MTITIVISREQPRRFARLKHRHELDGKSLLEHAGKPLYPKLPNYAIGVPSVMKAITPLRNFCYFTKAWQEYSFDLIVMRVRETFPQYDLAKQVEVGRKIFKSLYRDDAFQSNKAGTGTKHDYINGTNDDREDIKLESIFTGGNVVEVVGKQTRKFGADVYQIRCFDGSKPPPNVNEVNWKTHPELVGMATIETRIKTADGLREIRPFEYQKVKGLPYFVLVNGADVCYLGEERLVFISEKQAMANRPY